MAYDVFISYSTSDREIAEKVLSLLEHNFIKCWIAPRNILAGSDYGGAIIDAINNAAIVIVIFTENANQSNFVHKEAERASSKEKIIIPVRFQDILPSSKLELHISSGHWVDAITPPLEPHFEELVQTIRHLLAQNGRSVPSGVQKSADKNKDTEDIEFFNQLASDIKIQGADRNGLHILLKNEIRQIPNSLRDLKELLKDNNQVYFNYQDKVYHIETFTEETFNYVLGKFSFNQYLTRKLIETIRSENQTAQKIYDKLALRENWESDSKICDQVKVKISDLFIGVIGNQFRKLWSIGKEELSSNKIRNYVDKSIIIVGKTLELLFFVSLSKLWDEKKEHNIDLDESEAEVLNKRLNSLDDLSLPESLNALSVLLGVFEKHSDKIEYPFIGLKTLNAALKKSDELQLICLRFHDLHEKLKSDQVNLMDCYQTERDLASFFTCFNFLVNYNLSSMKSIEYRKYRNDAPKFLLKYVRINEKKEDVVKFSGGDNNTNSVLFHKGDNFDNAINLFPFIIDYNAITDENGSGICYFSSIYLDNDSYEYKYFENNESIKLIEQNLQEQDIDWNEFLKNDENRKKLNVNNVLKVLKDAKNSLLNNEIDLDNL